MFNPAGLKDGFKDSSTRALQGWSSTVVLRPPGTFSHISRQQEPAEGSGSSSCSVGSVSDAQVEETRGLELQVTSALEGLKVKAGPLTVEGQLLWSRLVPAALVSHTPWLLAVNWSPLVLGGASGEAAGVWMLPGWVEGFTPSVDQQLVCSTSTFIHEPEAHSSIRHPEDPLRSHDHSSLHPDTPLLTRPPDPGAVMFSLKKTASSSSSSSSLCWADLSQCPQFASKIHRTPPGGAAPAGGSRVD